MTSTGQPRLLVLYGSSAAVCGIGTWLECLSRQLNAQGWEVVVGLAWGRKFYDPLRFESAHPHLRTIRMDGRTGTRTGRLLSIRRAIRKTKPDLVLITLLDDALRVIPMLRSEGCTAKFGVVNHGNVPSHLAAIIESASYFDLVVSINRASYDLLRNWPGDHWSEGVLNLIPNAVPAPVLSGVRKENGRFQLGFVGRLSMEKGVNHLDRFLERLSEVGLDFELLIAGDGPERAVVDALVDQYQGRIKLLGAVSRDHLYREVYPVLDVVLCFSRSEGWPLALAEAMAHGVVPVSASYTGIHEEAVIRHDETGLIFPVDSPSTAADHIVALASDPARLQRLKAAARAEMQMNNSMDLFARRWHECLESCMHRPSRAPAPLPQPALGWRAGLVERIRKLLSWTVRHQSSRSEWPPLTPLDRTLVKSVADRLEYGRSPG